MGLGQSKPLPERKMRNGSIPGDQATLQKRGLELRERLNDVTLDTAARLGVQLELADILLELDDGAEAFTLARESLDTSLLLEDYEAAARACDAMYRSEQDDSLIALGHGIWLAVACPIDPQLSLDLLHHLVEETPADSDGAAVAAMLGYFLVEARASEEQREHLSFVARQLVAQVAERHRGITEDEAIGIWAQIHELDDVDVLLERMRVIIEAITEVWWFERDELRKKFGFEKTEEGEVSN